MDTGAADNTADVAIEYAPMKPGTRIEIHSPAEGWEPAIVQRMHPADRATLPAGYERVMFRDGGKMTVHCAGAGVRFPKVSA